MMRAWMVALLLLGLLAPALPALAQGAPSLQLLERWSQAIDAVDVAMDKQDYVAAERSFLQALAAARAMGADCEQVELTHMLGMAMYMTMKNTPKAETQASSMLAVAESRTGKTSSHTAAALALVAAFYDEAGMPEKAEAPALRALAILEKDPAADKSRMVSLLMRVSSAQMMNARWLEALTTLNRIRTLKGDPADPPTTGDCALMLMQSRALSAVGKVIEAEQLTRKAWTTLKRVKGIDFALTIDAQQRQAAMLDMLGRDVEANALIIELLERSLADPTFETLDLLAEAASFASTVGDLAAEEKFLLQARQLAEKLRKGKPLPEHAARTLALMEGQRLRSLGYWAKAEAMERDRLKLESAKRPNSHLHGLTRLSIASLVHEQGRVDEALLLIRDARQAIEKGFGAASPPGLAYLGMVGEITLDRGKPAEAEPFVLAAHQTAQTIYGKDNLAALAEVNMLLADLRRLQGRPAEALAPATAAVDGMAAKLGVTDMPGNTDALLALANVNRDIGSPASLKAAEDGYKKVLAIREGKLNADHPCIAEALERYAEYLLKVGRAREAADCTARAKKIRGT